LPVPPILTYHPQATIISAAGTAHTASATLNPDLFFAIRGGGCNFGVATEFVYQLHPQRTTVFCGMLFFPPTALEKLVEVTKSWYEGVGEKEGMLQILTVGPDGNVRGGHDLLLCAFSDVVDFG
jgi:FAD/FMN-containing dehydrogenase